MARVLIGCECSGAVREAFRRLGHEAWSCDLKPAEDGSPFHLRIPVEQAILDGPWDFIGLHPPCTALAKSGNAHYARGKARHAERLEAIAWTSSLWALAREEARFAYLENPEGVLRTQGTGFDWPCNIQPYEFGHDAKKKTSLWLHNLPHLKPTERVPGRMVKGVERWANQLDSGQNRLAPGPNRAADRSRTYQGIADAMAAQWAPLLSEP